MGQDDLRGLELGHHHGRLDALALDRRDEAPGGQIDDDFEHARRRHDDQPRLTWQRRARLPRDHVGLRRFVEQDRRELRAREAGVRPRDLGGHADFVRRQRVERVSGGEGRQEEHGKVSEDRQRQSNELASVGPHLRPAAGAGVGAAPAARARGLGCPRRYARRDWFRR